jgi:hypothetical protein
MYPLISAKLCQQGSDPLVMAGQYFRCENRRVACPCLPDGEGRDRDAGRHLNDGKQRVETAQVMRGNRDA